MAHRITTLIAASLLLATAMQAQTHIFHRVLAYDGNGLVNMGDELVLPLDTASNHALPQQNLVYHEGLYYHVFYKHAGDWDIYLHTSVDGITWGAPLQVNDDSLNAVQVAPNLLVYAADGATHVVVSWDDRRTGHAQFRTATSTDGGASFGPSVALSNHPNSVYCYGNLSVDAAGKLYAVWYKDDGGSIFGTWFSSSTDGGTTWSPMAQIGTPGMFSEPCHVIAHGTDSVLAFFSQDQSFHKNIIQLRSTDAGANFTSSSVTAYTLSGSITQYQSSFVDETGEVHLVFIYGANNITNIYHLTSADWGLTWSPPVAVNDVEELFSPWSFASGQAPSIASPRLGTIYIGWADQRAGTGNWDIYLTRSVDNGVTWDTDLMVNDLPATMGQYQMSIAVEATGPTSENVLVMWTDDRVDIGTGLPHATLPSTARLYPVPTSNRAVLQLPSAVGSSLWMVLYDARGAEIARQRTTGSETVIDMAGYAPGLYHVRVPELGLAMPVVKE